VGDWNGSGTKKIGVFRSSSGGFWVLDYNGNFQWDGTSIDRAYNFGLSGDTPVVGKWPVTGTTPAQFTMTATPTSQSTVQGGSTQYQITITPANGFSGTVVLSAHGMPIGVSAAFSPASVTGPGWSSYLTLATNNPNTPTGSAPITVMGTSGSSAGPGMVVVLNVTSAAPPPPPATVPTSSTVIPFGWNSPAETLMFTTNTDSSYAPSYFEVVIENAGIVSANHNVNAYHACYIYYDAPGNTLSLWTDDWPGGGFVNPGGSTPGTVPPNPVENSQCRLDVSRSWVQTVGTQMTLQLAVMFKPIFSGPKEMFVDTGDAASPRNELYWTNRGSWTVPNSSLVPVTTDHYDVFRTGANVHETTLTTTNAGNLRTPPGVISLPSGDGSCIWAQPLYVPNVTIRGGTYNGQTKNVLYVATARANVYAYDADTYVLLWSRALGQNNLGPSLGGATAPPPTAVGNGGDTDLVDCSGSSSVGSESGIVGTPVIDLSSNTMYVVGNLFVNSTVEHYLFGIDISTGLDSLAPRTIVSSGSVSVPFAPAMQLQRAGMLLADYNVLVPYASYADHTPYQGWMFGFNRGNLGLLDNWNYGGTNGGVGIWMSAGGPAFDGTSVYFATGNNSPDNPGPNPPRTPIGYSNSVLQVSPYGSPPGKQGAGLAQINCFTPPQATAWVGGDKDLGSSRVIVVPGTNVALVGGKAGNIYVVDRTSLSASTCGSSYVAAFNIVQGDNLDGGSSDLDAGLAVWNHSVYTWGGSSDTLRAFSLPPAAIGTPFGSDGPDTDFAEQGIPISISANFDDPNTGLVWAVVPTTGTLDPHADGAPMHFVSGQLRVYNATTLNQIMPSYDLLGNNIVKFTPPVVANGKVYVVTASQKILVFAP
jgi:hypothetical protein